MASDDVRSEELLTELSDYVGTEIKYVGIEEFESGKEHVVGYTKDRQLKSFFGQWETTTYENKKWDKIILVKTNDNRAVKFAVEPKDYANEVTTSYDGLFFHVTKTDMENDDKKLITYIARKVKDALSNEPHPIIKRK